MGRPWIHDFWAVTSTFHQILKFVKNDKLVIIYSEEPLLVSHLSYFRYIDVDEEAVGTQFQALYIVNFVQKSGESMDSLKDAQQVVKSGQ